MKRLLFAAAIAAIAPLAAQAESDYTAGLGVSSASAKLNFSITIPSVLFLQVGTGTTSPNYADNTNVDTINFTVPAGSVGAGPVGGMAGTGGDLGNGAVTVRVLANLGSVSLRSNVTGPLRTSAPNGPTVPWSDITVKADPLPGTATAGFTNGAITHPTFSTATIGGDSSAVTLTGDNGVVRKEGKWTFAYANTASPPAGTYGYASAAATGNGTVTYTLNTAP